MQITVDGSLALPTYERATTIELVAWHSSEPGTRSETFTFTLTELDCAIRWQGASFDAVYVWLVNTEATKSFSQAINTSCPSKCISDFYA